MDPDLVNLQGEVLALRLAVGVLIEALPEALRTAVYAKIMKINSLLESEQLLETDQVTTFRGNESYSRVH